MAEPQKQCSLLEELDQRQDEVLAQLEQLNRRLETLLRECLPSRSGQLELVEG